MRVIQGSNSKRRETTTTTAAAAAAAARRNENKEEKEQCVPQTRAPGRNKWPSACTTAATAPRTLGLHTHANKQLHNRINNNSSKIKLSARSKKRTVKVRQLEHRSTALACSANDLGCVDLHKVVLQQELAEQKTHHRLNAENGVVGRRLFCYFSPKRTIKCCFAFVLKCCDTVKATTTAATYADIDPAEVQARSGSRAHCESGASKTASGRPASSMLNGRIETL